MGGIIMSFGTDTSEKSEYIRGVTAERERVVDVLNKGKDALYQIMPDGHWDGILQAKFDVLLWVEEQVRKGEQ
jgi:hypothetical protein